MKIFRTYSQHPLRCLYYLFSFGFSSFQELFDVKSTIQNIESRISETSSILEISSSSSFLSVRNESISDIIQHQLKLQQVFKQVDNLELFINRIEFDTNRLEKQVQLANDELDFPGKKLDIVLKTFKMLGTVSSSLPQVTNYVSQNGGFQAYDTFQTKNYIYSENLKK